MAPTPGRAEISNPRLARARTPLDSRRRARARARAGGGGSLSNRGSLAGCCIFNFCCDDNGNAGKARWELFLALYYYSKYSKYELVQLYTYPPEY